MELVDITREIYDSANRLKNGSSEIFKLAKEKAEHERTYRKALAIEILTLRENKLPATIIGDVARGKTADLKFERDLAEARWTTARESLDAIKSQMSGLQTVLKYQTEADNGR